MTNHNILPGDAISTGFDGLLPTTEAAAMLAPACATFSASFVPGFGASSGAGAASATAVFHRPLTTGLRALDAERVARSPDYV